MTYVTTKVLRSLMRRFGTYQVLRKVTISLMEFQKFSLSLVVSFKAQKIAQQTCDPHHCPMQLQPQSDP
jgi:hypothetical protein